MPRDSSAYQITIYPLAPGYDLDQVRTPGTYDVLNPPGLTPGAYFLTVLRFQNARPDNLIVRQTATEAIGGVSYVRTFNGASWTSWVSIGGGSSSAYTTPNEVIAAINSGLNKTSWQGSASVYNVLDYGADPTGVAESSTAIQAALDAAKNAGGGVVYIPKGTYKIIYQGSASLGGVRVGNNTTVVGDGMGATILKLADIGNNDIAGVVRSYSGVENNSIVIRDLTVDGNKTAQTGWANVIVMYFGVTPDDRVHSDKDIWCINVEAKNGRNGTTGTANPTRGYGFDPHEVVDRFVAINCHAHDNERDGFVLDGVINFKLLGCHSYNNGRYGINLITMTFNGEVLGCHVHDNGSNGIMVQANSHSNIIANNYISNNAEQGIRIRRGGNVVTGYAPILNTYCKVHGNIIKNSGRSGINITGACYNTITDNTIINSSQSAHNTYFDVNIDEDDGDTGTFTGASYNTISGNLAVADGTSANLSKAGFREDLTGALPSYNVYMWNTASGQTQGKYLTLSSTSKRLDFSGTFYNALDFGVDPSGNTDCLPAINDMMDAIAPYGGVAYFPTGTYAIIPTGSTTWNGIVIPSNVTLLGDGPGLTVFNLLSSTPTITTGINGLLRNTTGVANSNIHIKGVTVDCSGGLHGGGGYIMGIFFTGTGDSNHSITDVEVKDALNGTGTSGYGVQLGGTGDGYYITNLYSHNNARDGLYINGVSGVNVQRSRFTSNGRHGVLADNGAHDIVFNFCESVSNTTNNFLVQGDSYDVRVRGGVNKGAGDEGFRVRRGTTVVDTYVSILDMIHTLNQRDGVKLSGAANNRVMGCLFKDNGQAANNVYSDVIMLLDTTNSGSKAQYNIIADNAMLATATNKVKYGVNEVSVNDADNNEIRFSYISGPATSAYNVFGAGTKKVDVASLAGGTAAGSSYTFQYNNGSNAFAGAPGLTYDTTTNRPAVPNGLRLPAVALDSATVPAVSGLALASKQFGSNGYLMEPALVDPIGRVRSLQNRLAGRNYSFWTVPNETTTTITQQMGISLATTTAASWFTTAVGGAALSATTKLGTMRRVNFNSAPSGGSGAAFVCTSNNYYTRGAATGVGGFYYSTTILVNTRSTNSKAFFGLSTHSGAATTPWFGSTNAVASASDLFGVGWETGDTNLSIFTNDNSGTATKIDLGATFPVSDNKAYELIIACKPGDTTVYYYLRDITTGDETAGAVTTDLPRNTVFLAPFFGMNNGGDTAIMSFSVSTIYAEQDL